MVRGLGKPDQDPHKRLPVGGIIVSSILMGVGVFMLLLGSIMTLLIQINLAAILIGSIVSFSGIAIYMPSVISMSSTLASYARARYRELREAITRTQSNDLQEASEEILGNESQAPTLLNSIKLSMVSIILIILLLISIFIDIPAIARLILMLIGSTIAPITMITAAYSLVEETRTWLEKQIAIERYILSKTYRDYSAGKAVQSLKKQLISNAMLASIVTMGLYMIYSIPATILEINKYVE